MSALSSYYRDYPTAGQEALTPADLAELRGHLRILDRKLSRLLPQEPDVGQAMNDLDRKLCQLRSAGIHLQRQLQARMDGEDQGDPRLKRGIPRVMKTLSTPGDGEALLRGAQAALAIGPYTYAKWCEQQRERIAAD